jgi:hypothetical protein
MMTSPLLLDDYARSVMRERMAEAQQAALLAEARRAPRITLRQSQPVIASARVRLAEGLRWLACRLDPCAVASEPPRLVVIARARAS